MRKTLKVFGFVFIFCIFFSFAGTVTLSQVADKKVNQVTDTQLPDEDSTYLSTILSAIGGFGGGGLLLIFLVRRFIQNYDDTIKKWDDKFEKVTEKYDTALTDLCDKWAEKYEKLTVKIETQIDETREHLQELKFELVKFKEMVVTKDACFSAHKDVIRLKEKVDSIENNFKKRKVS